MYLFVNETRSHCGLPDLCCPIHRDVCYKAKSAADVKLGFCTEKCQHSLPCGHPCSLPCHWPQSSHNMKCTVQLDSPCFRHSSKISCHHLLTHAPGAMNASSALTNYKCPQNVPSTLPCGHVFQVACWKDTKMTSGETPWPACTRPSPKPYTFPVCGHSMAVTCRELDEFSQDPRLAKCEEDENYQPDCGHIKPMKCWRRVEFESGAKAYVCGKQQQVVLPRCGHEHFLPCNAAQSLNSWTGTSCDEVGKVFEGASYGPKDFDCGEPITLVRKCGHQTRLPCNEAFLRVDSIGPCRQLVATRHPVCGHPSSVPCRFMSAIDVNNIPAELSEIREGTIQRFDTLPAGVPKCKSSVSFVRKCGHIEKIMCWSKSLTVYWITVLLLKRSSPWPHLCLSR